MDAKLPSSRHYGPQQAPSNSFHKADIGMTGHAPSSKLTSTSISENGLTSPIPSAPSLSLPKGGGAIQTMGEKFDVVLATGTGSTTIPVRLSPGRAGMQPQLSLNYDSGSGNGPFGLGWRLSGLSSITRKTAMGLPRYRDAGPDWDADVFLLDSEDLVPLFKRDAENKIVNSTGGPSLDECILNGYTVRRYGSRITKEFSRIERWTSLADPDDVHWRTISPQNTTTIFGSDSSSRIMDPVSSTGDPLRIFSWLVSEMYDCRGNAIMYSYKSEDSNNVSVEEVYEANRHDVSRSANRYIKSIKYGNTIPNREGEHWTPNPASVLPSHAWKFSVLFDYGEHNPEIPGLEETNAWPCRPDPFSKYQSGYEVRTYRLCRRIVMFHHFQELQALSYPIASTDLTYHENPFSTYLTSASKVGYILDPNKAAIKRSLPPVTFEYSSFPSDQELDALIVQEADEASLQNLPIGLDGVTFQWVDLDGEGLSGLLSEQAGAWFYKRNLSANNMGPSTDARNPSLRNAQAKFGPLEIISAKPAVAINGRTHFGDVQGAGKLDVIQTTSQSWGYYEKKRKGDGWTSFRPFLEFPNIDTADPNVKFVDLTGDGLADILIYADQVFCWHQSRGADGYSPGRIVAQPWDEDLGPVCVCSDTEQTIYLADMSGDGLSDVVRIRNGDVCYWPNCGYGKFGAIVRMGNAPWFDSAELFHQRRIHLADIDGSGTTDILYLSSDGVDMYLNQSGNSFEGRKTLRSFPSMDDLSTVQTVDLLGNGTTCIVWSSPLPTAYPSTLRYLDLTRNMKPHLLTRMNNNLGAETFIQYAPSTKFYLCDQENGTPWITKLPFPVHCVERIEVVDAISKSHFVKRYSYHHGYYDIQERAFQGFARVEEYDTDSFSTMGALDASNVDAAWHVPPLHTKTWFHTGVFIDKDRISRHMAHEYFGAPSSQDQGAVAAFAQTLLPDTILPSENVSAGSLLEACRALTGRILRTEIYADDDRAKAKIPYSVQESSFSVKALQDVEDANQHCIYFVHPLEMISYHYERDVSDPRIQHEMNLQVDDYGNVRKSLQLSYGRTPGKTTLSGIDKIRQETTVFLYSEHDVTELLSTPTDYLMPVAYETREYELSGFHLGDSSSRFSLSDFISNDFALLKSLTVIPFEQQNTVGVKQKRLIAQSRMMYRKDDLSGLLAPGIVESLALPGAAYHLCFTASLISAVYQRQTGSGQLETLFPNPGDFLASIGKQSGGYVDLDGDASWWKTDGRVFYHQESTAPASQELAAARANFFQPQAFADPFGSRKLVSYDSYMLYPVRVTDPVGNVVAVEMDYRVLAPALLTDPNGNRTAVAFDAIGLVAGTAQMGRIGEDIGDTLENFEAELTEQIVDEFLVNPKDVAAQLLGNATTRFIDDPRRYWKSGNSKMPTYSAMVSRESHMSDNVRKEDLKQQIRFAYSDGFGRVIQEKAQHDAGPLVPDGPDVLKRWVGSGWTIYNNKGKPVREYEPFFDDTHEFKFLMKTGVSSIVMYDPLMRVVAKLHPDHTIEKVVFGAWSESHFDANDNVSLSNPKGDPDIGQLFDRLPESEYLPSWYDARANGQLQGDEQAVAARTLLHAETPRKVHLDPLAHVLLNEDDAGGGTVMQTRFKIDIQGYERQTFDAAGRLAKSCDYNLCGDLIHETSIDSGQRWRVDDVSGNQLLAWNSRNFRFRSVYDLARRPLELWVWESGSPSAELLLEKTVYGETAENPSVNNLLNKPYQVFDQAGTVQFNNYDFKGNLVDSHRQLAKTYTTSLDWSQQVELEEQKYASTVSYDALNRILQSTSPDMSVIARMYGDSGYLNRLFTNIRGENANPDPSSWTAILKKVEYNARGQTTTVLHGNGVTTERSYHPLTFRLRNLRTCRNSRAEALQDLRYTYDPVGNVSHVHDAAQQIIYFRNTAVTPDSDYTYDPLYRLITATGREHMGQTNGRPGGPTAPGPADMPNVDTPNDGRVMGRYIESYKYNSVGNMLSIQHSGSDSLHPGWKRTHAYGPDNNRLVSSSVGSATESFRYDAHGNTTALPHLSVMRWNHEDQLCATSKQVVLNGGTPETTYYVYDSAGRRIRKVTETQAGSGSAPSATIMKERIYLDGFEIFRKFAPSGDEILLERVTLSVSDGSKRMALIETRTQGTDDGSQRLLRYQFDNLLGSACIELDDQARIISYEEFFPFGSSSYRAVANQNEAPKRYRFTGMERDAQTGLYYHGNRYYMAWLGRWSSCDPAGFVDGPNLYVYVQNRPTVLQDPTGTQGQKPDRKHGATPPAPPAKLKKGGPSGGSKTAKPSSKPKPKADPYAGANKDYLKRKGSREFQQFEKAVAGLKDPTPPPMTAAEKTEDVDINTKTHDNLVKQTLNEALERSIEHFTDPKTHKFTGTGRQVLAYALEQFIVPLRRKDLTNSQDLVLRDAGHYLAGRLQQWQYSPEFKDALKGTPLKGLSSKPPGVNLSNLSGIASWYYDHKKIEDFKKEAASGGGAGRTSGDRSGWPASAAGGRDWDELGTEQFQNEQDTIYKHKPPELVEDTPFRFPWQQ